MGFGQWEFRRAGCRYPLVVLNNPSARGLVRGLIEPPAKGLLRIGVSPDAVTVIGTLGASGAALWFVPRGEFVIAVIVVALFAVSDLLDGTMARLRGTSGAWGNFLDSTLDRVTDGAIFASFALYGLSVANAWITGGALLALVTGQVVSYAKARAEAVGATANVGIAERAERLILLGVGVIVTAAGIGVALPITLWLVGVLGLITIIQRMLHVRAQLRA
jgi:CDP-diacylglycerol---glycerol-3-phosphate 3-phosphatidyltransferase